MNDTINTNRITLNEDGTKAIMHGINGTPIFTSPIASLHSFDVDGHEGLTMEVVGWGEFVSYDDGQTWQDCE